MFNCVDESMYILENGLIDIDRVKEDCVKYHVLDYYNGEVEKADGAMLVKHGSGGQQIARVSGPAIVLSHSASRAHPSGYVVYLMDNSAKVEGAE